MRNQKSQALARKRIIKARGNKCEICGYTGYIELHHKVPMILGGYHEESNVILLCEKCHADAHGNNKKRYIDKKRQFWIGG